MNLGYRLNFKKAMELCSGDYIFLCDQDDIWLPNKVEEMVHIMKTHSNMHVLSSSFIYIDDKNHITDRIRFYHKLDDRVFLLKLIPGSSGAIIDSLAETTDALIIESFGVGGLPDYGDDEFYQAIRRFVEKGKIVIMATQVTHEGSDMSVYQVGKMIKREFSLLESYDMTLEATVAKTMWALQESIDPDGFREKFYKKINHDIMFSPEQNH